MDSKNTEYLVEKLIQVNEQILDKLNDIQGEISEIRSELDWASNNNSKIIELLNDIANGILNIDSNTSEYNSPNNGSKDISTSFPALRREKSSQKPITITLNKDEKYKVHKREISVYSNLDYSVDGKISRSQTENIHKRNMGKEYIQILSLSNMTKLELRIISDL